MPLVWPSQAHRGVLYMIGENYFPLKPKELAVKTSGERDACAVQNRFSLKFLKLWILINLVRT